MAGNRLSGVRLMLDWGARPLLDTHTLYVRMVHRALRRYADRACRAAIPAEAAPLVAIHLRGACKDLGIPIPDYLRSWWPD